MRRRRGKPGTPVKSAFVDPNEILPFSIAEGTNHPAISGTFKPMTTIKKGMYLDMLEKGEQNVAILTINTICEYLLSWNLEQPINQETVGTLKDAVVQELLKVILEGQQKN